MTTFVEMEALVIAQTRRPEIPAITQAAIRSATLRAHHVDFFPRDQANAPVLYTADSAASYYDIANISDTLPRLRSLKFLNGLEAASFRPVERLEYRDSDDTYDADGNLRKACYTLIGDTLRFWPMLATGRLEAWYYQNPLTAGLTYSSWIANLYPDEVAQWAAGIVWARTGFAEMAQDTMRTHVGPFKEMLVASHLLGNVA